MRMEFSHDDNFLLAISRDHHFSISYIKRTGMDEISHQLLIGQEAHKRIVWACSWNPFSHECCTGSRDKTVKIWAVEKGSSVKLLTTLLLPKSNVTSCVGLDRQSNYGFIAVGIENGLIELWSISIKRDEDGAALLRTAALVKQFDPFIYHVSAVNCLAWRNAEKREACVSMELAPCGADHCVRIFRVNYI